MPLPDPGEPASDPNRLSAQIGPCDMLCNLLRLPSGTDEAEDMKLNLKVKEQGLLGWSPYSAFTGFWCRGRAKAQALKIRSRE